MLRADHPIPDPSLSPSPLSPKHINTMVKLTVKAEEINYIIYRYLLENGFKSTAFCFRAEANISPMKFQSSAYAIAGGGPKSCRRSTSTSSTNQPFFFPPNCLLALIHKAMLYLWVEYHTASEVKPADVLPSPLGKKCNEL